MTDPQAQYVAGRLIYHGYEGVEQNREQAREWYQKAADQGYENAQKALQEF